jgi:hypothetical protein
VLKRLATREPICAAASAADQLDASLPKALQFAAFSAGITSTPNGWLHDVFKSLTCSLFHEFQREMRDTSKKFEDA